MGRYRLQKPLCIPQFVLIVMLYIMFYANLCYTVQIEKLTLTYLLIYNGEFYLFILRKYHGFEKLNLFLGTYGYNLSQQIDLFIFLIWHGIEY